jgi:TRAP-type transport system small permease protein
MKIFKKIIKSIADFLGVTVVNISFIIIFVTFLLTIVSRYIFKHPVTWSYEISVLAYMWTMFFGVGKAMETDEHVVFGLVYDKRTPAGKFVFLLIYNITLIALLVISFIPCVQSLLSKRMVTGVLKFPYKIIFAPFIYMMIDIIVRSFINIRKAYITYKTDNSEIPAAVKKEIEK